LSRGKARRFEAAQAAPVASSRASALSGSVVSGQTGSLQPVGSSISPGPRAAIRLRLVIERSKLGVMVNTTAEGLAERMKLAMAKVGKSNIIDAPAKRLTDTAD
jgi:hypothetical protein